MASAPSNLPKAPPLQVQGFRAQFRGANLWDLVQMECLAKNRRVVRVTTMGNVGYLYFDQGNVIHAATREQQGETAALEMLGWNSGSFEPCEREWPSLATISISWQGLMLKAAHQSDEVGRLRAGHPSDEIGRHKLVAVPSPEPFDESPGLKTSVESQMTMMAQPGNLNFPEDDAAVAVRLSPSGDLLSSTGEADEFANIAAYTCRIVEILGELMGMEHFQGLECTFKRGRCFIVKETDGTILALKPTPQANVARMKERAGL